MRIFIVSLLCTFTILANALKSEDLSSLDSKLISVVTPERIQKMSGLYEDEVLFCTGFLISERHILTVAECLKTFFTIPPPHFSDYYAKLGNLYLFSGIMEKHAFDKVEIHKNYDHESEELANNIGLITLSISDTSERITSWMEYTSEKIRLKSFYGVPGWGSYDGVRQDIEKILRWAQVKSIPVKGTCQFLLDPKILDGAKMICSNRDTRHGRFTMEEHDLGAPLLNNRNEAVGILCHVPRSRDLVQIAVYMKIDAYEPWITEAMLDESERTDITLPFKIVRSLEVSDYLSCTGKK